ncbi:hypothetical protein EJ05DRAFT_490522 [Pseudovirgaria hyperparasitica]|uniref:Uncharacterized protein n=1 Tax=Pseudovirgaria hyperparasitica TaxID=470096 RepID=A0A6A6VUJ4_9PEZI|nr:uncharacterized protein EJ05DRAFT_490522 [Pseudovirgaria hyperparasitica]KAF2752917.1 hypothetical protein EJ05DRAFT_490522 [Pseudovirgaria hyperparasitica]
MTGTSEDTVDLGAVLVAIAPYIVLCPDTFSFVLYLISFLFGIFAFNSLHTEDFDLFDGYDFLVITGLLSLDRQSAFASFQAIMPMVIWSATVLLPLVHWLVKKISPAMYVRYRRMRKSQAHEFRRIMGRGERVGNVEAGGGGESVGREEAERINEETPLRRDERKT